MLFTNRLSCVSVGRGRNWRVQNGVVILIIPAVGNEMHLATSECLPYTLVVKTALNFSNLITLVVRIALNFSNLITLFLQTCKFRSSNISANKTSTFI